MPLTVPAPAKAASERSVGRWPEEERLRILRDYAILDTPPERELDDLARIAACVCGVPVAMVSLVDRDRQFFKARVGIDQSETPRDLSFCTHAIEGQNDLMVVPDATVDPRFSDNPMVTGEPKIRFYAGTVLLSAEGAALGTLCVIDKRPRELTVEQKDALRAIARQVVSHFEMRRAAAALATLELRLGAERAVMIEEKRNRARGATVREEALGILGHDLRTPLNAITLSVELMRRGEGAGDERPEHHERLIHHIGAATSRMSAMVEELLDFTRSRLGGGIPVNAAPTDLGPTARHIVEELGVAHPTRRIVLDADGDLRLSCDLGRIAQVITNLVGNAVDHGATDRPITVRLRGEADTVLLSVHNEGPPIPPERQRDIFEPFRRGESRRVQTGLGLGLHIVRQITLAHGGDVTLESTDSEGTTFTVRLPRTPPQSQ